MSLNGLDDVKVSEAYQSALAEAGGWFLLKYASRDSVEVLTRGSGGLAEARGAVAQYEEKSPLYGFLLYRRRKVLIKYIPEGTSRLLQARVAVHFQAVAEKFSPHDTIFSITTAEDLNDSALISACALHTAAPSSCSSSGSSRRHKLDGITEDAEEGQSTAADDTVSLARPTTAASIPTIVEPNGVETKPWAKIETKPEVIEPIKAPLSEKPVQPQEKQVTASEAAADAVAESSISEKPEIKTIDYRDNLKNFESLFENGPDPRFSSQTARPSISELYSSIYDQYKPKVKLGPRPRPSIDGGKRPHTSGNTTSEVARPVSTLPAGLRIATRKADPKRPKSRDSSVVPSIAFPPPPPIPNIPEMPLGSPMRPTSSHASVKSMPATSHKSPGLTPEKQRLMRALELRKRQMKAQKEKEARRAEESSKEVVLATVSEAPVIPARSAARNSKQPAVRDTITPDTKVTATEEGPSIEKETPSQPRQEHVSRNNTPPPILNHSQEDPAAEMMNSQGETDDQQSSASASSPTSAQTKASSDATSTRPSSISEAEDHDTATPGGKPNLSLESESEQSRTESTQSQEEERDSIESSPTVVPENVSPESPVDATNQSSSESLKSSGEIEQEKSTIGKVEMLESVEPTAVSTLKRRSTVEVKEKRRALVEPIQVNISAEESDAEYLSDDSFMEELQSAKFEEAKPVSVAKSPMSPFFPRKSSVSEVTIPERSSSNQYRTGRLSPEQLGGDRTSSGSWLAKPSPENVGFAKKINVSSGISQRIKALAEKSNRESTASVSPTTTPDASNSIVAQRKSSFFSSPASGSPPFAQPNKRFSRASVTSFTSPTPNRQSVIQPQTSAQPVYSVQKPPEKLESVQVTARIIRDPRTQSPNLTMPTENTPLELHQSPIIIDHHKVSVLAPTSKAAIPKLEPMSPMRPSSPPSRDAALPRSSSDSSWRSIGRRMSESKGSVAVRSQSSVSLDSFDEKRDERKDKKDSRTSRLFKRMSSSITSSSRKSQAISPTLREEDDELSMLPMLREPPPAVQVGDLNVQFPDTLLWKRRWVEIDGTGNLVLTLSKANEHPRGITKRFHLSEFRAPYAPDQDQQELPNSVILDFLDGRTLQCACETFVAQVQVLQILREAHDAWMAYGQLQ